MSSSVLAHLRDVLRETREPLGKEPAAGFDEVSARYPAGGENAIRRFEKEETAPRYTDIDAMAEAYAIATETPSVFDLWDEAIRRAKAGKPVSTEQPGARAVRASKKAREETLRGRAKSPGKQPSKAKRRQAG